MKVRCGVSLGLAMGLLVAWPGGERALRAADDELKPAVRAAADKAVDYLLTRQRNGIWQHLDGANMQADLGATALVGLALLASDPKRCDKALTAADGAIASNLNSVTQTYSIAMCIIYLEKRKKSTGNLIGKLISGQHKNGTWGYHCPTQNGTQYDNSNTHFAVLALLVARKNNNSAQLEQALKRAESHFRATQLQDGPWRYDEDTTGQGTVSMTCAGLLGLAVGLDFSRRDYEVSLKGSAAGSTKVAKAEEAYINELQKFQKDKQVQKAREFLLRYVTSTNPDLVQHLTYVLWSVERIAFIYGERTFYGDVDWYEMGCRVLLKLQKENGRWEVDHLQGPHVDTALALLFLRKVNLLDLSMDVVLSGRGSIRQSNPAVKKKVQGPKGTPEEAKKLAEEMKTAIGPRVDEILKKMEDNTDAAYREALLDIIYNEKEIRGSYRNKARDALANRMSRLEADKVARYLTEDDKELRKSALLGAERAEYRELIPNIIDRLNDKDPDVAKLAHEVLKAMTKQDHGSTPDGWKRWYEANKKKPAN